MSSRETRKKSKIDRNSIVKIDLAIECEDGFVGMIRDLKHEPTNIPFPLSDNSVTLMSAANTIHRINPLEKGFIKWMDEVWRVLKVGGQMRLVTPYGVNTAFLSDPCAVNPCTPQTFYFFDPLNPIGLYKKYKPKPWKVEEVYWKPDGLMEVLLSKRAQDISYGKN